MGFGFDCCEKRRTTLSSFFPQPEIKGAETRALWTTIAAKRKRKRVWWIIIARDVVLLLCLCASDARVSEKGTQDNTREKVFFASLLSLPSCVTLFSWQEMPWSESVRRWGNNLGQKKRPRDIKGEQIDGYGKKYHVTKKKKQWMKICALIPESWSGWVAIASLSSGLCPWFLYFTWKVRTTESNVVRQRKFRNWNSLPQGSVVAAKTA